MSKKNEKVENEVVTEKVEVTPEEKEQEVNTEEVKPEETTEKVEEKQEEKQEEAKEEVKEEKPKNEKVENEEKLVAKIEFYDKYTDVKYKKGTEFIVSDVKETEKIGEDKYKISKARADEIKVKGYIE